MTDRQFVRSIYPTARLYTLSFLDSKSLYDIRTKELILTSWWAASPKDAWWEAATIIKNDLLRKLES